MLFCRADVSKHYNLLFHYNQIGRKCTVNFTEQIQGFHCTESKMPGEALDQSASGERFSFNIKQSFMKKTD